MKRLIILMLGIIFLLQCASSPEKKRLKMEQEREKLEMRKKYLEAENFIKDKKRDENLYWGEGFATIGGDLGKAKELAKERALQELSSQIEVKIESAIKRVLSGSSISSGKQYEEVIRDEFTQKVKLYTRQVISNIREASFIDYPKPGNITYFVYLSRRDYEERVEKDLNAKKAMIRSTIRNGTLEFGNRNFILAINHWLTAKNYLNDFFGHLPLQDDLDGDGLTEEVNAYLIQKINNFFGNISFSFLNQDITYDVQGELTQKPVVYAVFTDQLGQSHPVKNLPLQVDFISGAGQISGNISTSNYGQATLPISRVNPAYTTTVLKVSVDINRIPGINLVSLPVLPAVQLTLKKVKTVGIAISLKGSRNSLFKNELHTEINSLFLNKGFSTLIIDQEKSENENPDPVLQKAMAENVDYLLWIKIVVTPGKTVGGYQNMYMATSKGQILFYKLPQAMLVSSDNIPGLRGFGVSASIARGDALQNSQNKITTMVQKIIENIR